MLFLLLKENNILLTGVNGFAFGLNSLALGLRVDFLNDVVILSIDGS